MITLSSRQARMCMRNSIISAVLWWVFGTMFTGPNFSGFLLALKLGEGRIGIMLSLGMLFLPIQLIGAYIQRSYFDRKKFCIFCVFLHYFFFGLMGVLAAYWADIPFAWASALMMAFYALSLFVSNAQSPVQIAWHGDFVPPRESASFWSMRAGISSLMAIVAGILMGMLIDRIGREDRLSYVIAIAIAFAFAMVSLLVFDRVIDPKPEPEGNENFFRLVREVWGNRQFRFLAFFFGVQSFVVGLSGNFCAVHLQKTLHCSLTQIQIFSAIGAIVGFFSSYLFKVIGSKYGRKPILVICGFLKGGEFLLWASLIPVNRAFDTAGMHLINSVAGAFGFGECHLPPGALMMLPTYVVASFVNMGLGAGQLSLLTSMGNKKTQGIAIALFFSVLGICGFVAGSPSGFLLERLSACEFLSSRGLTGFNFMALVTAIGLVLNALFFLRFREDGAAPTTAVVRVLLSTNPIRSIYQSHILSRPMSELKRINTLHKASGELVSGELVHDLYSPSSRVRNSALLNLTNGDTPLNDLMERELIKLLGFPELGMQSGAAEALGRQKSKAAVPVLIKLFDSPDLSVAMSAVFAVGLIGDASAEKALKNVLSDRKKAILHPAAAEALSKVGSHRNVWKIFDALSNQTYYVLHQQCLESLARLMSNHRDKIHSSFETEDRLPGSEIARLIRAISRHDTWEGASVAPPDFESTLDFYDRNLYHRCLENIIPAELALFGIEPDAKITSWQFLSEAFLPGGRMRYERLDRDDYFADNLHLQLKLWAELKYDPDNQDRFILLTALLTALSLLSRKYHADHDGEHPSLLHTITLP